MGRKVFGVINGAVAAVFLLSAALQFNDPDPGGWIAIYVAAAAACLVAPRARLGWWLAVAVAVVALPWAVALSPILPMY